MTYQNLTVEERDRIAHLTINRPKALNALNQQTLRELARFFGTDYADRHNLHGIILTGAGDRAFVAGADIKEFLGVAEGGNGAEMARRGHDIFFLIERFHLPVIALIDGFALGGGCELAMACHLRIATDRARFGQPEVNLGIIPGYGGTQRLNHYMSKGQVMELVLTGNMIDAREAYRIGLVNYVLPADQAQEKAQELLQTIGKKGPLAIAAAIEAVNAYYDHPDGYTTEATAFGRTTQTEDFREGATAFVEKRGAEFRRK
jgi:enoyl-CoA hydratase